MWHALLDLAFGTQRPGGSPKNPSALGRARLDLEVLDERVVPALGYFHFDSGAGDLAITGTEYNDTLHIYHLPGQTVVSLSNVGTPTVLTFADWQVRFVRFYAQGGHDYYQNDTGIWTDFFGGAGNDTFLGGSGDDWAFGEDGWDTLHGRAGNDRLDGGYDGNKVDYLNGGTGYDTFVQHYYQNFLGSRSYQYETINDPDGGWSYFEWIHHGWW